MFVLFIDFYDGINVFFKKLFDLFYFVMGLGSLVGVGFDNGSVMIGLIFEIFF